MVFSSRLLLALSCVGVGVYASDPEEAALGGIHGGSPHLGDHSHHHPIGQHPIINPSISIGLNHTAHPTGPSKPTATPHDPHGRKHPYGSPLLDGFHCTLECVSTRSPMIQDSKNPLAGCTFICVKGTINYHFHPDEATTVHPSGIMPKIGNEHGNFQVEQMAVAEDAASAAAVGVKVTNPKLAVHGINNKDGVGKGIDKYTMYTGNGQSWPQRNKWVSFVDMFNNNKPLMFGSCSWMNVPNNSGDEVGAIYDAIQKVAQETQTDHRFILAVMMQESGGCVRVHTTNYGVRNPGLMQDHNGKATCNEGGVKTPCPKNLITEMIREGTAGTTSGEGLAGALNRNGKDDTSAFYRAARLYNSGSIAPNGDLGGGIATHCYSSDIANRLTGWVHSPHACDLDKK